MDYITRRQFPNYLPKYPLTVPTSLATYSKSQFSPFHTFWTKIERTGGELKERPVTITSTTAATESPVFTDAIMAVRAQFENSNE